MKGDPKGGLPLPGRAAWLRPSIGGRGLGVFVVCFVLHCTPPDRQRERQAERKRMTVRHREPTHTEPSYRFLTYT